MGGPRRGLGAPGGLCPGPATPFAGHVRKGRQKQRHLRALLFLSDPRAHTPGTVQSSHDPRGAGQIKLFAGAGSAGSGRCSWGGPGQLKLPQMGRLGARCQRRSSGIPLVLSTHPSWAQHPASSPTLSHPHPHSPPPHRSHPQPQPHPWQPPLWRHLGCRSKPRDAGDASVSPRQTRARDRGGALSFCGDAFASPSRFLHPWAQVKLSGQCLGKAELVFGLLLCPTAPELAGGCRCLPRHQELGSSWTRRPGSCTGLETFGTI